MKRVRNNDAAAYTKLSTKNSDASDEETELLTKKNITFKEIPTIEKVIEEGDTLQSLSIRYHCTIAEIKRLNNIHRDNEIFARNMIKVPSSPFSMLVGVHTSGNNSPSGESHDLELLDKTLINQKLHKSLNIQPANNDFNAVIFNSNIVMNKNCDKIDVIDSLLLENFNEEEEIKLLPTDAAATDAIAAPIVMSRLACSGADADISWIALIVCIIVICIAVPLIYVFYVAEHPNEYHHKHHIPNNTLQ